MKMLDSNDDNNKKISHPNSQKPQNDQQTPNNNISKNNVNQGLPPGPVDDDIPFAPHFDGQF